MPSYYDPDDIAKFITEDPDKFDGDQVDNWEEVDDDDDDDDDGADFRHNQEQPGQHQHLVEELEAARLKSDMVEIHMRTNSVCFIVAYADEVEIDEQWVQVLNDSKSVFAHDGVSVYHVSYIAPHMH